MPKSVKVAVDYVIRSMRSQGTMHPPAHIVRDVINAYEDYRNEEATAPVVQKKALGSTVVLYLDRLHGGSGDIEERPGVGPYGPGKPQAFFVPEYGTDDRYRLSMPTEQWIALGRPVTLEVARG